MVVQLSAAICGAVIILAASSAAMARPEIVADHSYAVDGVASGATIRWRGIDVQSQPARISRGRRGYGVRRAL